MAAVRARLTYPHVVSTLALFIALGGSAWAIGANSVGSKQIKKNGVKNADIAANAVTSPKVADGTLLSSDFAAGQLPTGGGPSDTGADILGKLAPVDGSGSGLDADALDGISAGGFLQAGDSAAGDVSGPFSALNIGADTIGAGELASTRFFTNDHVSLNDPVPGGSTEVPLASDVPSGDYQFSAQCFQPVAGQPQASVWIKNTGMSNSSFDSNAPGGVNVVNLGPGGNVPLVITGGGPDSTFETGSYSGVSHTFQGIPRPISGVVYAGTKMTPFGECFAGVTAIG